MAPRQVIPLEKVHVFAGDGAQDHAVERPRSPRTAARVRAQWARARREIARVARRRAHHGVAEPGRGAEAEMLRAGVEAARRNAKAASDVLERLLETRRRDRLGG